MQSWSTEPKCDAEIVKLGQNYIKSTRPRPPWLTYTGTDPLTHTQSRTYFCHHSRPATKTAARAPSVGWYVALERLHARSETEVAFTVPGERDVVAEGETARPAMRSHDHAPNAERWATSCSGRGAMWWVECVHHRRRVDGKMLPPKIPHPSVA